MPYIEVITNVSEDLITPEFHKSLGDVVAKTLDRPREKTMVYIKTGLLKLARKLSIVFLTPHSISTNVMMSN